MYTYLHGRGQNSHLTCTGRVAIYTVSTCLVTCMSDTILHWQSVPYVYSKHVICNKQMLVTCSVWSPDLWPSTVGITLWSPDLWPLTFHCRYNPPKYSLGSYGSSGGSSREQKFGRHSAFGSQMSSEADKPSSKVSSFSSMQSSRSSTSSSSRLVHCTWCMCFGKYQASLIPRPSVQCTHLHTVLRVWERDYVLPGIINCAG